MQDSKQLEQGTVKRTGPNGRDFALGFDVGWQTQPLLGWICNKRSHFQDIDENFYGQSFWVTVLEFPPLQTTTTTGRGRDLENGFFFFNDFSPNQLSGSALRKS